MATVVKRSLGGEDPLKHSHPSEIATLSSSESASGSEPAETPNADAIIAAGGDITAVDKVAAIPIPKPVKQPKHKKGRKA